MGYGRLRDGADPLSLRQALVHHATHPSSKVDADVSSCSSVDFKKVPKTYMALCRGILHEEQIQQLRAGVELTGGLGTSLPAEVAI